MKRLLLLIALLLVTTSVYADEDIQSKIEQIQRIYITQHEINAQIELLNIKKAALLKTQNKIEYGVCTREDLNGDTTDESAQLNYIKDIADLEKAISTKEKELQNTDHLIELYNNIRTNETRSIDDVLKTYKNSPLTGDISFSNPTPKSRLSSRFGYRIHPIFKTKRYHEGIDLANDMGTPILASEKGIVIYSGKTPGYGNTVVLMHSNGYFTLYAHIKDKGFAVKNSDTVEKGAVIAYMGSTGFSTGPHLHFEIIKGTTRLDPLKYIKLGR